jgi:hypothetical protein
VPSASNMEARRRWCFMVVSLEGWKAGLACIFNVRTQGGDDKPIVSVCKAKGIGGVLCRRPLWNMRKQLLIL